MPSDLIKRLVLILDWYKGMVSRETGRLVYTYYPGEDVAVSNGSPIRDIASVWDVEVLSRFLDRSDLFPLVERSLQHYTSYLVENGDTLILDPGRIGEPSGIAHSAFMVLSLLHSSLPSRESKIVGLADGILRLQRRDGSYKIYFGDVPDDGLEFYPGEAMLALMETYASTRDSRYLASVERGFANCRDRIRETAVAPDLLVFYSNWQSQYAALLHEHTRRDGVRRAVRDYVFALHDRILDAGFYNAVEQLPMHQATVEVACALEGITDAHTIAARERNARHMQAFERCIGMALEYLFRAQRLEDCTPRERGGFGHSLTDRTQRIDVTGHVVGGFVKTARNRVPVTPHEA
jgi:hypothetical protein